MGVFRNSNAYSDNRPVALPIARNERGVASGTMTATRPRNGFKLIRSSKGV
jgi:hypothetical protein